MSAKKPKLNPLCTKLFLDDNLKRVQTHSDKHKYEVRFFKFVKLTRISKSFFGCSRNTSFDVYRINLTYSEYSENTRLYFTSKNYKFSVDNYISLECGKAQKLMKFLQPSCIGVYIVGNVKKEKFESLAKILQITTGKLGLFLGTYEQNKESVREILNKIVSRVHEFKCNTDYLDELSSFSNLDSLSVEWIKNIAQIQRILRCKTRTLTLNASYGYKIEEGIAQLSIDNKEESIDTSRLKELKLKSHDLAYETLGNIIGFLTNSCPTLKQFNIEHFIDFDNFDTGHDDDSYEYPTLEQLIDQIPTYVQQLKEFQSRFANEKTKMAIEFTPDITLSEEEYDDNEIDWVATISESPDLINWEKANKHDSDGNVLIDKLELKLASENCELKLVPGVRHYSSLSKALYGPDYYYDTDD